jgi:hypothetical protein
VIRRHRACLQDLHRAIHDAIPKTLGLNRPLQQRAV